MWLGGVFIADSKGLAGHSDADALTHAIIDALLGAAGKPDIGSRFPNTDVTWRGARSLDLLKIVWNELRAEQWQLVNLDCSVVAQSPKLAPHINKMKIALAATLQCDTTQIGIKATTPENLGALGRGEGIFASAVCLLSGL